MTRGRSAKNLSGICVAHAADHCHFKSSPRHWFDVLANKCCRSQIKLAAILQLNQQIGLNVELNSSTFRKLTQ
jgi:hypothetical protein